MSIQFASQGDLEDKNVTFEKLSGNAYAYITEVKETPPQELLLVMML